MVDQEDIENAAKETLAWPANKKWDTKEKDDRFRAFFVHFGAPSVVVARKAARGNFP